MLGLERKVDVDAALAKLTGRLVKRFEHRVTRERVEETVTACSAQFRDARIVDFVPVLTEKHCVARLRVIAEETSRRTDGAAA